MFYNTPLSETSDMVASAASELNYICEQLPFTIDTHTTQNSRYPTPCFHWIYYVGTSMVGN